METCKECGAAVEVVTPFAWKGDGVETRFTCGSCWARSGFTQSDRCKLGAKDSEILTLKAQVAGQTLGMMNFCEIVLSGKLCRTCEHMQGYCDCEQIVGLLQSEVTKTTPRSGTADAP